MNDIKILNQLPVIEKCRRIFQSIALLDAIIMPEWEYRYYSFNAKWYTNEMMASMRDGSGQHYFALFNKYGLIIKGFEHYSTVDNRFQQTGEIDKKIFKYVPVEFNNFLKENAFVIDKTTFCLWNLKNEEVWHSGKEHNSNELYLLKVLIDGAEGYVKWAEEYYETDIPISIVKDIFDFMPLNNDMIKSLNKEISLEDILEDIAEIAYPIGN